MPETDILNPTYVWSDDIQDSMSPDYGFEPRRSNTHLVKKAIGGRPWTRETANTGHTFTFSWLGRSFRCVQRLKRYYEQYGDGFFTIIDHDYKGSDDSRRGRHYVGRFTSEVVPVERGNNLYDVANVTFEEMPTAPMVRYPNDWVHDAIRFYAFNDFGDQKLATFTNTVNGWAANARVIAGRNVTTMDNPALQLNDGDWACYEYRGYGFKLYLLKGPGYGQCTVSLDGVQLGGTIDCTAAVDQGPQVVAMKEDVPLDFHRVQVTIVGAAPAIVLPIPVCWHSLEVMR